ncbi:hypothetical protein J2Z21_008617 [Streptomyces griseochromogenes]|uniref:Uncharacterized protein n=1 Tax=Streptomyces griseochromogenes TaxID=68214 RepID=A0ABS4M7F1_9ACTN|nr:hypothetical protein [Streptomyces griseochromogenes]
MDRRREVTVNGDFAYCVGIAHFMADRPFPRPSATC